VVEDGRPPSAVRSRRMGQGVGQQATTGSVPCARSLFHRCRRDVWSVGRVGVPGGGVRSYSVGAVRRHGSLMTSRRGIAALRQASSTFKETFTTRGDCRARDLRRRLVHRSALPLTESDVSADAPAATDHRNVMVMGNLVIPEVPNFDQVLHPVSGNTEEDAGWIRRNVRRARALPGHGGAVRHDP
jgi:hypothetical protein